MSRRKSLSRATLMLALLALVASACAGPQATGQPSQPWPTDTVIYDVPLPPGSRAATRSRTTGPIGTPAAPDAPGPRPHAMLTILHTNDARGYLEPCG